MSLPVWGVWIETLRKGYRSESGHVTPRMGVWVETIIIVMLSMKLMSPVEWIESAS